MPIFKLTAQDDSFLKTDGSDAGNDTINGFAGNDSIYGGGGSNLIYGGLGDDVITSANLLDQVFYGDTGNDRLVVYADVATGSQSLLYGGDGNDELQVTGDAGRDSLYGGAGDDMFAVQLDLTGTQKASLFGGLGADRLFLVMANYGGISVSDITMTQATGVGTVSINGAARLAVAEVESVTLSATATHVDLTGGAETDSFDVMGQTVRVAAGGGDDIVRLFGVMLGSGAVTLDGGTGTDRLEANFGPALGGYPAITTPVLLDLRTAAGVLQVGSGALGSVTGFEMVYFTGGSGNDMAYGSAGNDVLGGTDYVLHTDGQFENGDDVFYGGAGNDLLYGGMGYDSLMGDAGADKLFGGLEADALYGGDGNDILYGDMKDRLIDQGGNDFLFGGAGNDTIIGGAGADTMAGGTGSDLFVWKAMTDSGLAYGTLDNINFFTVSQSATTHIDQIDLSALDAKPLTTGDDAFAFIGQAAFTAVGQVRVVNVGPSAYVEINTGGTLDADMRICLVGVDAATIGAEDFIL